jgi:LETM1 and EF-hand domain-containing protein 1
VATAIKGTISDVSEAAKHGVLEPPPEGAGRIKRLWHQFKQLFQFYWRGVKMLFQHRKLATAIRKRIDEEKNNGEPSSLTRWESQFLRTHDSDMVKLVPFVLIIVTLEEILPLIVLYAPFLLPSTCILPSQLDRIAAKADEKKLEAIVSAQFLLSAMSEDASASAHDVVAGGLSGLSGEMAWTLCSLMSLSNKGPTFMLRRRLRKHLAYLDSDDTLLKKEHDGATLTTEELRDTLRERGFMTHNVDESKLRPGLKQWLANANDGQQRFLFVLRHALEIDTTRPPTKV